MQAEQLHPDCNQLTGLALGQLPPEEIEPAAAHLAECEACRDFVQSVPRDTFVSLIRDCETAVDPQTRKRAAAPGQTVDFSTSADDTPSSVPPQISDAPTMDPATSASGSANARESGNTLSLEACLLEHPRYHVVELLGHGGMGAVYKAEHRMMQRTVALKVINRQFVSNQSAVDRFHREVQAAARLQHPNIVTAFDAEQAGGTHFLVMEYVPGKDLDAVLKQKGPLPIIAACHFIRQVALGLQHAFEKGMVHRDIKPQNLMLTVKNQIKILDFGLASLSGDSNTNVALTRDNAIMGTPDYIAPEQARDAHSADIRADIYSLGCTMYRLLTDQVPFPKGSAIDKVMAHVGGTPTPVNVLRPELPDSLVRILDKMMAKDPADRFQTPAEVVKALTPFVTKKKAPHETTAMPARDRDPGEPTAPPKANAAISIPKFAPARNRRSPQSDPAAAAPALAPPRRRSLVGIFAAAAAFLLLIAGGIVFFLPTPDGLVRVEINDPKIKVSFNGKTYTFENGKDDLIKVTPGAHTLIVERDDLKFETPKFMLGKGENPSLRVEFVKGSLTVKMGDAVVAEHAVPAPTVVASAGWALEFDGKDDYVTLPPFLKEPSTKELTAEAWVTITDFSNGSWVQNVISGDWSSFIVGIHNTGQTWRCRVNNEDFPTDEKITADRLMHIALVMEPTVAQVYLDGRLIGIKKLPVPFNPATNQLCLGCLAQDKTSCMKGKLHAVRFSSTPRYKGKFTPQRQWKTDKDTLALYRFDEGKGDTLRDSSGNGYDGTIVGANWVRIGTTDSAKEKNAITLVRTFDQAHPFFINSVAVTPDGKYALSGMHMFPKDSLFLWDIATGKLVKPLAAKTPIGGVAVSSDGRYAATGGINTLFLWALPEGKLHKEIKAHDGVFFAVAISADNKHVLTASHDKTACVWDIESGRELSRITLPNICLDAAFLPNGHILVAAGRSELWDWKTKNPVRIFGSGTAVRSIAVSHDGEYLLEGRQDGAIYLIAIKTGLQLKSFAGHDRDVKALEFLPGNKHFVSGSDDGTLRVWSLDTGTEVARREADKNIFRALAITPDGLHVISGGGADPTSPAGKPQGTGDYALRLWRLPESVWPKATNAKDGLTLVQKLKAQRVPGTGMPLSLSRDGNLLLSAGDSYGLLWDMRKRDRIALLSSPDKSVLNAAISPNGLLGATSEFKGRLLLWDLPIGKLKAELATNLENVVRIDFSPDGQRLVATGKDLVEIWDVKDIQKKPHALRVPGYFTAVAFPPDGKTVLLSGMNPILFNMELGKVERTFSELPNFLGFDIHSDGRLVAATRSGAIYLWDLATGMERHRLPIDSARPQAIAFLPNPDYLAVGGEKGEIRILEWKTGEEIAKRDGLRHCSYQVLPLPNGRHMLSYGGWHHAKNAQMDPHDDLPIYLWLLPERVWLKEASKISSVKSTTPTSPFAPDSVANILISDEYEWTEAVNLGPKVNSKEADGSPWVSADGLTLLFASKRPEGKGDYDIWQCKRKSVDENWSEPVNLGGAINSPGFEGNVTLSEDMRTLIFAGVRLGGLGKMDLWMATRQSADAPWQAAVNLGTTINSPQGDTLPSLSSDGLQLTFVSDRSGRFELFITTRKSAKDGWSKPELFSKAGRRGGRIQLLDADTTLLYSPNSLDIYFAAWNATEKRWANDTRLPSPISDGNRNAQFYFCSSSNTLYFESDRPGGQGETDLWMARRVKKTAKEK